MSRDRAPVPVRRVVKNGSNTRERSSPAIPAPRSQPRSGSGRCWTVTSAARSHRARRRPPCTGDRHFRIRQDVHECQPAAPRPSPSAAIDRGRGRRLVRRRPNARLAPHLHTAMTSAGAMSNLIGLAKSGPRTRSGSAARFPHRCRSPPRRSSSGMNPRRNVRSAALMIIKDSVSRGRRRSTADRAMTAARAARLSLEVTNRVGHGVEGRGQQARIFIFPPAAGPGSSA